MLSAASTEGEVVQVHQTAVSLSGLMQVLGKNLYSTPLVAVRELVQNAHDSIIRRRLEDPAFAEMSGKITVVGDLARGIIRIIDTGAGLTSPEIENFLATVGAGYTRNLRAKHDDSGLIGMFGLGFISAFVLAEKVSVTTTSFQNPEQTLRYISHTGENYALSEVENRPVGTEVHLVLRPEFTYLSGPEALLGVLRKYCVLLHEPIFLNDGESPLNPETPPWRLPEAKQPEMPGWLYRKALEFADQFDPYFSPLGVMPIGPDPASESDATGLLWVQDGATYGTSDNRQLAVFGRGMLLNDDMRDLLPTWAGFISGIVESNQLTPTAAREDLQRDDAFLATKRHIQETLITGLAALARRSPEAWRRVLARHNEALLGAALCDERLFDLLADSVLIPSSQGDIPVAALRSASGTLHVRFGTSGGFEDMLFRALRTPVARGDVYAVLPFLRKWVDIRGGTLVELGTEKGNKSFFARQFLAQEEIDFLTDNLTDEERLIPARFLPEDLPLVVVRDREAELKQRMEQDEADKRISAAALRLVRNYTARITAASPSILYVNLANPAIQALLTGHRNNQNVRPVAALLRSLKTLMAASGDAREAGDVSTALADFSRVVADMLETH
ncbi:MAG: ATP-binding protein [Zoogloeaceae bacterium]|jgi:molecular chaperone HtpG|nr:ATP-binding protein [Zoogloeaceae bacterium]